MSGSTSFTNQNLPPKHQSVEDASVEKKLDLDFQSIALSRATRQGSEGMTGYDWDIRNLSPSQLEFKYGQQGRDVMQQVLGASNQRFEDAAAMSNRTGGQATYDTISGVGSGFAGSIANIGALGLGLVNEGAGTWAGEQIQRGNEWIQGTQSDGLNRARERLARETALATHDNEAQMRQEIAEGGSELVASLKRWGKDTVDSISLASSDPTTLVQGTGEAVGSLLAGGPIARGLRAIGAPVASRLRGSGGIGPMSRRADQLSRAGDWSAWPTAIAAMEAGGVYSAASSEIMGMDEAQLMEGSPDYRAMREQGISHEEARTTIANRGGLISAAMQAPTAFAAGTLTRFAERPFRTNSATSGLRNIFINEPLEEGVQSTTGGLSENIAIRATADENRDVVGGVGEQTGQGVLYGMTAAGTVQGPGTSARLAGRTVYHGMRGIGKAARGVSNFVVDRFDKAQAQADKESPISSERVEQAAANINEQVETIGNTFEQSVQQSDAPDEQKAREIDFAKNEIRRAINIDPQELESIPQNLREGIASSRNRIAAIKELATQIPFLEEGGLEHLEAIATMQQLLEPVRQTQMADLRILEGMPEDSPAKRALNAVKWMLTQADNTPEVRKVNRIVSNITTPEKIQRTIDLFGSDQAIRTPEGQAAAKVVVASMVNEPGTGNKEAAELILKHANSGALELSPSQRTAVELSLGLLTQHENLLAERDRLGIKDIVDVVGEEIISNKDPVSARNGAKGERRSLRWYTDRILKSMNSLNREEAGGWMEELGLFVQHMQNKVDALNQNYAEGDAVLVPNAPKVKYQALSPDHTADNLWYESPEGLHVSASNPTSIRVAQAVHTEAQTLANVYNGLAAAFPSLGIEAFNFQGLDPALLAPADEVIQQNKSNYANQRSSTAPAAPATPETTPSRTTTEERRERNRRANAEHKTKQERTKQEKPKTEAKPEVETEVEETGPTNAQWMKGDIKSLRPDVGRARFKHRNTTISYDVGEGNNIHIYLISTPREHRGKGSAREAMQTFLDLVDEAGEYTVTLSVAEQDTTTNRGGLMDFYNSFGFEGEGDTLTRVPASQRDVEAEGEFVPEFDPDSLIPENDNTPERRGMVNRFWSLWKPLTNKFLESFRLRPDKDDQPYSRISGLEKPSDWVRDALTDSNAFEDVLGKDFHITLDEELSDAYDNLLDSNEKSKGLTLGHVKAIMKKNLSSFLKGKNISKALESGEIARWNQGKALNIVQPVYDKDGNEVGLEYNEELLEAAIMGGLDWVLTGNHIVRQLEDEDFREITGIDPFLLTEDQKQRISVGLPHKEVKIPMARMIARFWGVQSRKNTDRAYNEGIPEAVAAEVTRALVEADFLNAWPTVLSAEQTGGKPKHLLTYSANLDKLPTTFNEYSDGIRDVILPDSEPTKWIGESEIPPVENRQMNNPAVENTRDQKRAIEAANKIKHYVNVPMMHFMNAFGVEGAIDLTGDVDPNWSIRNKNHHESLEGKALNYRNSFIETFGTIKRMMNYGQKTATKLAEVPIRYAHNMSKVGRMQMLGRYNSQGSKLTRELILPTWSTLDLTNNEGHQRAFYLSLAQHLGVKIHRQPYEASKNDVLKLLKSDEAKPLMKAMRDWLSKTDIHSEQLSDATLDGKEWQQLMANAGLPRDFGAYHAVMEYSRFMRARGKGRTEFRTGLYLEADGITNGPIMAMLMLTIGKFGGDRLYKDFDWLGALRKGGITFGRATPAHELIPLGGNVLELYETAAQNTIGPLKAKKAEIDSNGDSFVEHTNSLINVMTTLFKGEVKFGEDNELLLHRNITKNPLTITIYGSSPWGIAGSFVTRIQDSMYELQTRIASNTDQGFDPWFGLESFNIRGKEDLDRFQKSIRAVSSRSVGFNRETGWSLSRETNVKHDNRATFTFELTELRNLQSNLHNIFVTPMVTGITETVGSGVMQAAETIRKATQVQSIYLQEAYRQAVLDKVEDRRKNDPTFKQGDFLSQEAIEEIEADMAKKFPNIKTKSQVFRVAKKVGVMGDGKSNYSRAYDGSMGTDPDVAAPGNSGVSGTAYVNIGFGDGHMIQIAIQNPLLDSVLAVFDGINMPLDRVNEISEVANNAVYEAGMGNPMQAIKDSFDVFMENAYTDANLSEEAWSELARAFYGQSNKVTVEATQKDIKTLMGTLRSQVDYGARSIHARHRAIKEVGGMSIDHMAGVGQPTLIGQAHDLTEAQVRELLQAKYEKYMAQDQKPVKPKYSLKDRGELDENGGTGVSMFRWDGIKHLAKELDLSNEQTQILNQLIAAKGADGYNIVAGTRDQILSYRVSRGQDTEVFDENTNGLISINDKTIYLINPTGETFTHELIHASTMQTLLAYYQGENLGPNKTVVEGAIKRLEDMASWFLHEDMPLSLAPEAQQAYMDAKAAMEGFLNNDHLDHGVAMAGMIGEFIAWTLANDKLSTDLKVKKVPRFIRWASDVILAIKELIWGKKEVPTPQMDWLSNIQFNANILMYTQPDVSQLFTEASLKHSSDNPRLQGIRETFQNLVVDSIKQNKKIDQPYQHKEQARAITATQEVAKKAAHAFGLSHIEESTLTSIATALSTVTGLDSQLMMGMQNMYKVVQEQLKIDDFSRDGQEDPWANEKFNIIMGRRDRFYSQDNISNLLPVFVGLSMVSDQFRRVLSDLTLPKTAKDYSSVDGWVGSNGYIAMEKLNNLMTKQGNNRTVQGALDVMMDRLMKGIHDEKTMLDSLEEMSDRGLGLNTYVRDLMQAASRKAWDFGTHLSNTSDNKVVQSVGRAMSIVSSIANEEKADIVADGILKTGTRLNLPNAFMHLIKDLMGRTEATADVYDRIKPTRAMVQQVRQQFRDEVPNAILKKFSEHPTDEQLASMFRGMGKTDLAALLVQGVSRKDVMNLLTSARDRRTKINDLQNQLKQMDPKHYNILDKKMKQLADHMNQKGTGRNLLRNAYAVANLWNESGVRNRKAPTTQMVGLVDQLVTLYAFNGLSDNDKNSLRHLVENESEGVDFVLAYLQGQRATEVARSKLGRARQNHYKGYIPSLPENQGHLIVAEDSDFSDLRLSGYTRVGSYGGVSLGSNRVSMGYYYSSTPSRAAFAQGMMQNIVQSGSGVERTTGFTMGHTAGRITNKFMVNKLIQRMHADTGQHENLMPIFNDRGRIVAFERSVDPKYLQQIQPSTKIHNMLGVWRGRQIEEKLSTEMNKDLLDTLHKNWTENRSDSDLYVNLLDPSVLDRVQQDAVDLFSEETRKYAESLFGKNTLMVRADLLDDVTGYRNPTVGDFWTNNNRLNKRTNEVMKRMLIGFLGMDAYQRLSKAEQIIQGLVSDARTLIVVKSGLIPAINIISNVYQLLGRGVNPIQMAKEFPKKLNEINTYVRTKLEQVDLEAQIRAAGDDTRLKTRLHARIRSITDSHKRMTIWPLIQAGEFSTIADVGMSRDDLKLSAGRAGEWLDQQVGKMPDGLQTVAKYGVVSKDTALFQGLQKSVQYGDFLAKALLYDHLLKKESKTREQALAQITEEFVNYDRLPGRFRGYAENMGMAWFYNFKLRSTKVGLSILRNNPLHALLVMGLPMPYGIGTPVDENVINKGLEGTLGYTIGPGMGLRAPSLNPWFNLVN